MGLILANMPTTQSFPAASLRPPIRSRPDLPPTNSAAFTTKGTTHRSRLTGFLVVRSSEDDSSPPPSRSEASTAAQVENPPAEAPKGQPSLISALNVEKALRGIAITDVDHYAVLGIARGCPYDLVPVAYNDKVKELMNQELQEEELNSQLEQLKDSYAILSTVEERRLYDWSLARIEQRDEYKWPFEADITQIPTGTPPPGEPEDVGPTRLVGYFFLGWLILSFIMSTVLNL